MVRRDLSQIQFSKEERAILVKELQRYFREELGEELGQFSAEFLLDFISEKIGPLYYNRGLLDARAVLDKQMDSLSEAIYGLEKPSDLSR